MTRKLAVTVFAISLAAFGCGSESETKKDGGDAGSKDVGAASDVKLDVTPVSPDAGDAAADVAPTPDVQPATDLVLADAPTDIAQPADGKIDAPPADGKLDVAPTGPEAGIEAGPASEAGTTEGGATTEAGSEDAPQG